MENTHATFISKQVAFNKYQGFSHKHLLVEKQIKQKEKHISTQLDPRGEFSSTLQYVTVFK